MTQTVSNMAGSTFSRRWRLRDPVLIAETFSSRIFKATRTDGTPVVVKALKPFDDVEDELRGQHFLKWRDGAGAVRLLAVSGQMMLLEYAGERSLAEYLRKAGDRGATEIAAEVLARLMAPSRRRAPAALQPLRERYAALFAVAEQVSSGPYVEAARLARRLLDSPHEIRPLHGDLHHDNILLSPRGWLAIDPKGVLGNPAFDAANLFYNPLDRDDLCLDAERIAHMAETFGAVLGQKPETILDHAVAYGCLSAAWHAGDDNTADERRELRVAAAIGAVRLSF